MDIVLFENAGKQKYNAGSKARQDALKIAVDCGYKHVALFHNENSRPIIACEIIRGCVSAICQAGKGDRLLIQYPYSPALLNKILFWILRIGKKIKKFNITVLLHDLHGIRNEGAENLFQNEQLRSELHMMRDCQLIYHNEAMRMICESVYPATSYEILGPFDYLYSGKTSERRYSLSPVVMIAGYLGADKSKYVYELNTIKNLRVDLFGVNYSGKGTETIRYRGKFDPEELVEKLDGQFGLVWDGDSIDTCGGKTGNYLRYNDPHKFSLYIAAGVPLIVWKESALAKYVEENGIGICMDSLRDLPSALKNVSCGEYDKMVTDVNRIKEEIQSGCHLSRILREEKNSK